MACGFPCFHRLGKRMVRRSPPKAIPAGVGAQYLCQNGSTSVQPRCSQEVPRLQIQSLRITWLAPPTESRATTIGITTTLGHAWLLLTLHAPAEGCCEVCSATEIRRSSAAVRESSLIVSGRVC